MIASFLKRAAAIALAVSLSACQSFPGGGAAPQATEPAWAEVKPHVFLRYQVTGQGPQTLVLIHYASGSLEAWDEVIPYLEKPGRTIIRYDVRGSGLSTKIRQPVTMVDMTGDLSALLTKLNVSGPVVLVGDTLGATIAMQYAADYPQAVVGVVALSPTAHFEPQPKFLEKFPDPLAPGAAIASLADKGFDPTDPKSVHVGRVKQLDMAYPKELRTDPRRFARFYGIFQSADPTSAAMVMRMVYSTGFADVFPRIKAPVLMAGGTLFVKPMEGYRKLAAAIPNATFVEMRTGHFASIESPELVGPLVTGFLEKVGL